MAERNLILRMIMGGTAEAAADLGRVNAELDRTHMKSRRASESTNVLAKGFGGLRTVIRTVTGVVGLAGVGLGVGEMIKNAERFQNSAAQLGASIRSNIRNPVRDAQKSMLEFVDTFTSHGGFAPPQEIDALTQLLRITHNTRRAMQDLTLATNIARGSHKDLSIATRAVAMVEGGRLTMLTRLGIVLPKGTSATKAYSILLQRYAGSTAAYNNTAAGAMTNFEHAIDVVGEKLGLKLVPYLTIAFTWLAHVIDMAERGQGVFHVIGQITHWVGDNFHYVTDAVKGAYEWVRRQIDLFREGDPRVRAIAIGVGSVAVGFLALNAALKVYAVVQWLANAAMAAFPLVLIVAALVAFVAGLVYAYEKVGWFRRFVDGLWSSIKGGAQVVIDWFKGGGWKTIEHVISWPFTRLPDIIRGAFGHVKAAVIVGVNDVINVINAMIRAYNALPGTPNIGLIPLIGQKPKTPQLPTKRDMAPAWVLRPGISPIGTDRAPAKASPLSISPHGTDRAPTSISPRGADQAPANDVASAVAGAIHGAGVYMDGQQVGKLMIRQGNLQRARQ